MEAPEKLYVDTKDNLSDSILYGFTEKRKDDDIEYIRKDAIVEKVCEWFEEHFEDIGLEWLSGYSVDEVIENFKKDMER